MVVELLITDRSRGMCWKEMHEAEDPARLRLDRLEGLMMELGFVRGIQCDATARVVEAVEVHG